MRDALRQLYLLLVRGKVEGCSLDRFESATGLPVSALDVPLGAARRQGLLDDDACGRLRASALGYRHLNRLTGLFL